MQSQVTKQQNTKWYDTIGIHRSQYITPLHHSVIRVSKVSNDTENNKEPPIVSTGKLTFIAADQATVMILTIDAKLKQNSENVCQQHLIKQITPAPGPLFAQSSWTMRADGIFYLSRDYNIRELRHWVPIFEHKNTLFPTDAFNDGYSHKQTDGVSISG